MVRCSLSPSPHLVRPQLTSRTQEARIYGQLTMCPGRSAASCSNQFNLLTNRLSSVLAPGSSNQAAVAPKPKKKRPSSGPGQPVPPDAPLQPQQFQFAPINEASNPTAFQAVSLAPGETPEKAGKKRGRPSKAERELREAEAAARGEVYQPTKRKKQTPRPSAEGVGVQSAGEGEAEATPDSRKKSKKPKTTSVAPMAPPMGVPTQGEPGVPAAVGSGDQMQIDTPERPVTSTIPETQISEFQATESLLAGMREQAAQSEAPKTTAPSQIETAQSSMTLQQGSATGEHYGPSYPTTS